MKRTDPNRRGVLAGIAALAALPGHAKGRDGGLPLGPPEPFDATQIEAMARRLSQSPYQAPPRLPQPWLDLSYDDFRRIQFNPDYALWRDSTRPAQLQFFSAGLYFPSPIDVYTVEGGEARHIDFRWDAFDKRGELPPLPIEGHAGYSGFRIHGEISKPGRFDEYAVFQGASYFRGIGAGHAYGISARGLALNTGDAAGEEFPEFRTFWVEAPEPGAPDTIVHALLDSPSVAGAYRFRISPGETTVMDIEATLFPRTELENVGIAPGTSMFFFDETNRNRFDDFRPQVHDSDGLLVANGAGEMLWRPLKNPTTLQISSFVDNSPRGFGLMQRERELRDFADLEAHYHRRPSLWVEPLEDWGEGMVRLVEIPADLEIYDNIVAYWKPMTPLAPGEVHRFSYRLHWCSEAPVTRDVSRVLNTRMGKRHFGPGRVAVIDFAPHPRLPENPEDVTVFTGSNQATTTDGVLQKNPDTGGLRLAFGFDPKERRAAELRAQLLHEGTTVSEVWLYRWTAT